MTTNSTISASPLCWPEGKPRTTSWLRTPGKFGSRGNPVTIRSALDEIYHELELMGIGDWQCIISSNLELRQDGDPRSGQRSPQDPGVAVWWRSSREKPYTCVASDQYQKVEHNMWAIAKTIWAIRGIERWSGKAARDQAFTGFKALPQESTRHWSDVLEVEKSQDLKTIKARYQHMRSRAHPDKGGSSAWLHEVQKAWEQAQSELSTKPHKLERIAMLHVDCPYCGLVQEVIQDDGHGCEDGALYEEVCDSCEKSFAIYPHISYHFTSRKADCMNGAPHDWKTHEHIYHNDLKYRSCADCGKSEYFEEAATTT